MGLFRKTPRVDPAEVMALQEALESLKERLDASEQAKEMLEARVGILNETTSLLAARSNELDDMTQRMAEVEVLKRQVAQLDVVNAKLISLESLNPKIVDLTERVNASAADAKSAKDYSTTLNERVSNISREFANQLSELSKEMDQLSRRPAPEPVVVSAPEPAVTEDMIEELHDSQVRLANEQARYEIAFRQDLAMLADQVRRPRTP
jgi:chromosome segregation ATPase